MASPDWAAWQARFAARASRPLPPVHLPELPEAQRVALAASLATFQLGEAGEGRIAHQIQTWVHPSIDNHYRSSLGLFVREEARHGQLLGHMVRSLGGQRARHNWTEVLFRRGRRLLGIRLKLLVLLAAEVAAKVFYGVLAEGLPPSDLRDALLEIAQDEALHLDFHTAFFQAQVRGLGARCVFLGAWWAVSTAACLAVALDHRHTLAAV